MIYLVDNYPYNGQSALNYILYRMSYLASIYIRYPKFRLLPLLYIYKLYNAHLSCMSFTQNVSTTSNVNTIYTFPLCNVYFGRSSI